MYHTDISNSKRNPFRIKMLKIPINPYNSPIQNVLICHW